MTTSMNSLRAPDIRGFNYLGSWGTSGLDLWLHHDQDAMTREVQRGKKYFPGWNVVRWWLSHEAFHRDPEKFLSHLEAGLALFAHHDIQTIPVLFNRWHNPICDFGGVSLDHFVPDTSFWCSTEDFAERDHSPSTDGTRLLTDDSRVTRAFGDYLDAVVGRHAADERIHSWDLCNEPFFGPHVLDPESATHQAELRWLTWCRERCKAAGARQPFTIGNIGQLDAITVTAPLCDYLSFHPYYMPQGAPGMLGESWPDVTTKAGFEGLLDDVVRLAADLDKPLVANETAWGALDDRERAEMTRYTLGALTARGIGFVVHALNHSLVADLHAPEFGPVGPPGRLEFIEADGSLRSGHDVFNEFA